MLHQPHNKIKNLKRISRIVTLPDYQGVGIGTTLLNYVASLYDRVTIVTTTPALIHSFNKSDNWKLTRQGRVAKQGSSTSMRYDISNHRITTTWEYKK